MSSNKPTDFQSRRKPDRSLSEASSVRAGLGRRSDQLPAQLQASTMQTASTRRGSSQRSYAKLPPSKREASRLFHAFPTLAFSKYLRKSFPHDNIQQSNKKYTKGLVRNQNFE